LTSSGRDGDVSEHVGVAPDQLGHDALGHVVDGVAGPVGRLRRDPGVEHDLEQHVAELVPERRRVPLSSASSAS